ncbi:putative bifunctional trehalose-6-phosphate synthase/HAD hydrolase subfamily IIB [Halolamina pelagica]|uniref:Putative bifunctional trehalose-6-phosphate synthase/HAD hydrolase subfamily IIB n=1 Tax=Halolamina pelagica TaxID=699431 RepID=A0A0N8HZS6_9EURY|nr:trehalose-6-phosphate synthase [Halolamina pelagica]KPN30331.1 putative bifunctional trehalose-6-phosphate synthase/HAD hydrolase subfamily IIB [Halolamina pelagica]
MIDDASGDRSLVVVSNREPYVHEYADGEPTVERPAGGLVSALDGVVTETGGTWVAWGSGDADFDPAVAPDGEIELPPGAADSTAADDPPGYTLSRVDLPRRLVENYYYGYSNQVLWPICHLEADPVTVDPEFAPAYREANRLFADHVVAADPDVVWFQDYHLALAPGYVREERPDARLVQFWHVPWPTPEFFEICPQAVELLRGLLGNDAVGFHLERYAANFRDCVAQFVPDAAVMESGEVRYDGRTVETYASPIGVDADRVAENARSDAARHYWDRVVDRYDLDPNRSVVLGVDRLDYTKGIVERLDALAHLLETNPDLAGEFTYVQKGTRTREGIPAYRRYYDEVRDRIAELDRVHGTADWTPAVYIEDDVDDRELAGLYRNADVAVVSSRRDGMNLVAKEFVAAQGRPFPNAGLAQARGLGTPTRDRVPGALVLSQFVGAAESLCPAALSVNPYDVSTFAGTIREALAMGENERRDRMDSLRSSVREADIDAWLATQLDVLAADERAAPANDD